MRKQRCASCGGFLVAQNIVYEKKVGEKRVVFENVPAMVCASCDEVWFDGKTAEKIERLFQKKILPSRWLKVPVFSYSHAS